MAADYLTSHQFIDDFALEYHRRVADRLRRSPSETIAFARIRQKRRRSNDAFGPGELRAFAEWDAILNAPLDRIAALITEESERGQRIRQSSPFAGFLPDDERLRILDECEERARHLAHPAR